MYAMHPTIVLHTCDTVDPCGLMLLWFQALGGGPGQCPMDGRAITLSLTLPSVSAYFHKCGTND